MCTMEPAAFQNPRRRPCILRPASRTTPADVRIEIVRSRGKWRVVQDPAELHTGGDQASWDLSELIAEFPPGTDFRIEFFGGPPGYDPVRGPFTKPIERSGASLVAGARGTDWGCYYYDIWAMTQYEAYKLDFPIDPQIDNLPPPPRTVYPRHPEPDHG